jgi:type II secretory pathway predicted ATPase ExeA
MVAIKEKTFIYPANERGLMFFAQSALFNEDGSYKGHLLVTGVVGSGKSTFVQRYLGDAALNPAGYMTIRHIYQEWEKNRVFTCCCRHTTRYWIINRTPPKRLNLS